MMKRLRFILVALLACAGFAAHSEELRLGPDLFAAGETRTVTEAVERDAFVAGERLRLAAPVGGSAHIAGRDITVEGDITQNLYAAGYALRLRGDIGQSASLAGYTITVDGQVGGAVRASAAELSINAAIGGPALLTGGTVTLNAPVSGDVMLTAGEVIWGEAARIEGRLTLTAENAAGIDVPDTVIAPERITRIEVEDGAADIREVAERQARRGMAAAFWGFAKTVLVVTVITALVAAIAPKALAATRERMLTHPFAAFGWGFVMLSALIGSAFVLALSILGLLAVPVALIAAGLAAMAGYVIGAYGAGVAAFHLAGRGLPTTVGARALRGASGAVLLGVIALIPFFGWLVTGTASLIGLGAITQHWLRPRLFAA